ncbi:MAG: hypothetical protein K8H86_02060 [Ignavibacteriaceae bacterium]|nr:hypothetical protein [Ignavibacteriaceae bacterium]
MEIKPLSTNPYLNKDVVQTKKGKDVEENMKPKDRLELSSEAKQIKDDQLDLKKLDAIKQKIANKFYDSDEVIGKVADAILKETLPK